MTKELIEKSIKALEGVYGRKLTEEEINQIKEKYGNPKAKDIEFRDGEIDYTDLSTKKQFQLLIRALNDLNTRLQMQVETTNDLYYSFAYYLKKNGVSDPFKEIEEFSNEEYEKMKKGE